MPCEPTQVLGRWKQDRLEQLLDSDDEARRRRRHGGDLRGVMDDLIDLGVMQRLRNGRINVPDVYRLGFKMRRKGAIPPGKA